jgi:lactoylglutathione lyase
VTNVSPRTGPQAGGTSLVVTGTGFALTGSGTLFSFGSRPVGPVRCSSSTTCTVASRAHSAGAVDVRVSVSGKRSRKSFRPLHVRIGNSRTHKREAVGPGGTSRNLSRAWRTFVGRVARLVGINHVALEVDDVEEALAWYGRVFDFKLRGRAGGRMAFIDMGDQFIALASGRSQPPDEDRHFGLVVDDKEAARAALRDAGVAVQASGSLDFVDPWGNHVQVVDYRDVQFTKTDDVLRAMGAGGLEKSDRALAELRDKGLLG